MNWLERFLVRMLIAQLDYTKPVIADKIIEAQKGLSNISPEGFANELVDEIEDALRKKFGIEKE